LKLISGKIYCQKAVKPVTLILPESRSYLGYFSNPNFYDGQTISNMSPQEGVI
jgi:hypothetical protein